MTDQHIQTVQVATVNYERYLSINDPSGAIQRAFGLLQNAGIIMLTRENIQRAPTKPHLKDGRLLVTSTGRVFILRMLDVMYFRCGITTLEKLERDYTATEPRQGA